MSGAIWISRWDEVAANWSEAMWRSCWQGGLFALLVWIGCRLWRHVPAAMRYALWWLVCLKLVVGLCPLFLTLPLLPPAPPPTSTPLPVAALPQAAPLQPTAPIAMTLRPAPLSAPGGRSERSMASLSPLAGFMGGWLVATGTLVGFAADSLRRLLRLMRQAEPLSDPALLAVAGEAATAMGVRDVPRILVTQADVGVLTFGVWRPVVLLSQRTLTACTPSELRLVFGHELAHIRRGDAWLGLLPQVTQILFCFYPPAWLACREIDLAREVVCDEQTLCALRARSDHYGRLLLKLGARHDSWFALYTPGVSSQFRVLQRRLSMLQQMTQTSPRRLRGRAILLVSLIGAAVAVPWSLVRAQNPGPNASGGAVQKQAVLRDHPASGSRQPAANGKVRGGKAKAGTAPARQKKGVAYLVAAKGRIAPPPAQQKGTVLANGKILPAEVRNRSAVASAATSLSSKKGAVGERVAPVAGGIAAAKADPEPKPQIRLFKLRFARAETIAKTLGTLFESTVPNPTRILADARTNTVIVQAGAERIQEITRILENLDTPEEADTEPRPRLQVYPLKYAKAGELGATLTALFADKGEVKIAPDATTNSIIVVADQRKADEISALVRTLDVPHH